MVASSSTRSLVSLEASASEKKHHVPLHVEYSQILDQMLDAEDCRVVQSWNCHVLHRDHVRRHPDLEIRIRPDHDLRDQIVVSSQSPMADLVLLALVEVEAAAGKKSLLPFGLVRQ